MQMARDAEGMTASLGSTVTGASDDDEARIAARSIVENNLVNAAGTARPLLGHG